VRADATRLAQVIDNLLENARKFTDRGGEVRVRLWSDAELEQAVVSVRDTGVGIEPEMLRRLFDAFAQADRSLDRSRGGLGLGLALVRGLVELHGGAIEARSAGIGKGAEFIIRLPLEPEPAALTEQRSPAGVGGAGLRVLIIEDNRDAAESLRDLLESYGYQVGVASTGPAGLDQARQTCPDVVLCDIGLPGMDGYAVAGALRQHEELSGTRLIALTGYGQEEDIRRSRAAGFDEHLVKPVDPERLLHELQTA
jgi:CheY-like chemotaxis protein